MLFLFAASPDFGIGQFACLLPSVEVVAVSQAPSPQSNPNSPSPVIATLPHEGHRQANRAKIRRQSRAIGRLHTVVSLKAFRSHELGLVLVSTTGEVAHSYVKENLHASWIVCTFCDWVRDPKGLTTAVLHVLASRFAKLSIQPKGPSSVDLL